MQTLEARQTAARDRAAKLGVRLQQVEAGHHYQTASQSVDDTVYNVTLAADGWQCECPGFIYTGVCKHTAAAEMRVERETAPRLAVSSQQANERFAALFGGK